MKLFSGAAALGAFATAQDAPSLRCYYGGGDAPPASYSLDFFGVSSGVCASFCVDCATVDEFDVLCTDEQKAAGAKLAQHLVLDPASAGAMESVYGASFSSCATDDCNAADPCGSGGDAPGDGPDGEAGETPGGEGTPARCYYGGGEFPPVSYSLDFFGVSSGVCASFCWDCAAADEFDTLCTDEQKAAGAKLAQHLVLDPGSVGYLGAVYGDSFLSCTTDDCNAADPCGGSGAPLQDPCAPCPNGVTADGPPEEGPEFCEELIASAAFFGADSESCTQIAIAVLCCPEDIAEAMDPCTMCPGGITAEGGESAMLPENDDDIVDDDGGGFTLTCGQMVSISKATSQESPQCEGFLFAQVFCCPSDLTSAPAADDPCIVCPDGVSAEPSTIVPDAGGLSCDVAVQFAASFDAGSEECRGAIDAEVEAICCPEQAKPAEMTDGEPATEPVPAPLDDPAKEPTPASPEDPTNEPAPTSLEDPAEEPDTTPPDDPTGGTTPTTPGAPGETLGVEALTAPSTEPATPALDSGALGPVPVPSPEETGGDTTLDNVDESSAYSALHLSVGVTLLASVLSYLS